MLEYYGSNSGIAAIMLRSLASDSRPEEYARILGDHPFPALGFWNIFYKRGE